ncbi:MAG: hypothetical protein WB689_04110, partial [Xanthobacteraceae bacterium]
MAERTQIFLMISNRKKNSGTPDRCDQCVERRPGEIASRAPAESGGGYAVQVLSQRNEEEVQSSFRALQAKYPK